MSPATASALVFAAVASGVIAFQVALALGAPWGAYAMGGAFPGRFPPAMRAAALVQAVVISLLALVTLSAANLLLPSLVDTLPWAVWVVVAVSLVSVVLNAISRSSGERWIWTPVALLMLTSSLIVALTAG